MLVPGMVTSRHWSSYKASPKGCFWLFHRIFEGMLCQLCCPISILSDTLLSNWVTSKQSE